MSDSGLGLSALAVAFLALILALGAFIYPTAPPNGNGNGVVVHTFGMVSITQLSNKVHYYALNDAIERYADPIVQCRVVNGTLKNFKVTVSWNDFDGLTSINMRRNGGNYGLINIPAGETGNFDYDVERAVSEGDLLDLRVDTDASTSGAINFTWSVDLQE